MNKTPDSPVIISVCGKGGVGKTSISALLTRLLAEKTGNKVLAIDADPATGLSRALDIPVYKTVDEIRSHLIKGLKSGKSINKKELSAHLDYEVFDSLAERENLAFLAIGRPETEGCYCQVNELLKDIIKDLANNFDYVIIDAEAGIEQVNRRVLEMVTHLLLVSDISAKGRNVVHTIEEVAKKVISFEKAGVIFNRVSKEEVEQVLPGMAIPVLGWMPEDKAIRQFDMEERSFFEMDSCPARESLSRAIEPFVK
ncbi:MAG: AAA family ATPase [bacterium]|nr:AAA family ATPase [bacterium]